MNGTSCPSNVTLRELKLGIIVCCAYGCPKDWSHCNLCRYTISGDIHGKAGDAGLCLFHFPIGRCTSTVIHPRRWDRRLIGTVRFCTVALRHASNEVGGRIYISMFTMFSVSSSLSSTNSFPLQSIFGLYGQSNPSSVVPVWLLNAFSMKSFHCCNSLFFLPGHWPVSLLL